MQSFSILDDNKVTAILSLYSKKKQIDVQITILNNQNNAHKQNYDAANDRYSLILPQQRRKILNKQLTEEDRIEIRTIISEKERARQQIEIGKLELAGLKERREQCEQELHELEYTIKEMLEENKLTSTAHRLPQQNESKINPEEQNENDCHNRYFGINDNYRSR